MGITVKRDFTISKWKVCASIWVALIAYSVYKIHFGLHPDETGWVADGFRFMKGVTIIKEHWFASLGGYFNCLFCGFTG